MAQPSLLDALRQYLRDAAPGGALNPEVTGQGILDAGALSTAPVPVVGDVVGLLADANRMRDPNERTPMNMALMALGALPFVPSGLRQAKKALGKADDAKRAKTSFEIAHEVAQKNAALPVSQGGLGLPPNNTAMDRAKALGFGDGWNHGTKGDKDWRGIEAFRKDMMEPGLTGKGVYTTNSPAIAGGGKGNTVAPQGYATNEALNHLMKREAELTAETNQIRKTLEGAVASGDQEKVKIFSDWLAANEKEIAELGQWKTGGGQVYPLMTKAENPFNPDRMKLKRSDLPKEVVAQIEDGLLSQGKNPKGKWPLSYSLLDIATGGVDNANNVLKDVGYDSLRYAGGRMTGVPLKHDVTMLFEPSQVRSRFAAFDPKKRDSGDLLASLAPYLITGGLAGLLGLSSDNANAGQ